VCSRLYGSEGRLLLSPILGCTYLILQAEERRQAHPLGRRMYQLKVSCIDSGSLPSPIEVITPAYI
jgi:hypothetical protein